MQCPIDGSTLVIAERSGVEIDYCPQCRGVWLDRGELDKILERSGGGGQAQPAAHVQGHMPQSQGKPYKKKKGVGSFLEDIFDF